MTGAQLGGLGVLFVWWSGRAVEWLYAVKHIYLSISVLFNRLLCLVFRPFFLVCVAEPTPSVGSASPTATFRLVTLQYSLELNHVQVVERHQMSVTAKDVHVALGVDDGNMSITSSRLDSSDEAKFVLVSVCGVMVVHAVLLSLLHLLGVLVEALVGVLDDESVHHGD